LSLNCVLLLSLNCALPLYLMKVNGGGEVDEEVDGDADEEEEADGNKEVHVGARHRKAR
jgi:hypothetical protein